MRIHPAWVLTLTMAVTTLLAPRLAIAEYVSFYPYGDQVKTASQGRSGWTGYHSTGFSSVAPNQAVSLPFAAETSPYFNPATTPPQTQAMPAAFTPGGAWAQGTGPVTPDGGHSCAACDSQGCAAGAGAYAPSYGYGGGYGDGFGGPMESQGGPYEDGSCGPRWYDVRVEAMYLKRDNVSRRVNFSQDGLAGFADPVFVLSTDDLDFEFEPGFRIEFRHEFGASSNVEASYFGTFHWSSSATATSDIDNLFSPFSDFGVDPAGGFLETDQATQHTIDYKSDLHSGEINWRTGYISPYARVHGSWYVGARYFNLNEQFSFHSVALQHIDPRTGLSRGPGEFTYQTRTNNNLIGAQLGTDLQICVLPGLMVGGEIAAGVFGNSSSQTNVLFGTTLDPALRERVTREDVALAGEAGVSAVWQITPRFTLRGGYEVLYIDGVALAPENFDPTPPFLIPSAPRNPQVNDNGHVLYHGVTAGVEYIW